MGNGFWIVAVVAAVVGLVVWRFGRRSPGNRVIGTQEQLRGRMLARSHRNRATSDAGYTGWYGGWSAGDSGGSHCGGGFFGGDGGGGGFGGDGGGGGSC